MNEDDLRNAMQYRVNDVRPDRERLFAARLTAANRRRRRDTFKAAVAGCALTAFASLVIVNVNGSGAGKAPAPLDNQVVNLAAQVEATAPAPPTPASNARGGLLVGAAASGRLVQIDPINGKTMKLITTVHDPKDVSKGGLLGHVAISLDGKTIYFDRATSDGCGEIDSVSINGGNPTSVARGNNPAISSDGESLAYVKSACTAPQIVVHGLTTGDERVAVESSGQVAPSSIANISWSPDNKSLLLDMRYKSSSSDTLAIATVSKTSAYTDLRVLMPPADNPGTVWQWGTYLSDGRIFLSQRCCTSATGISDRSSQLSIIDPSNPGSTLIAYGVTNKSHSFTGQDSGGKELFYLSGTDLMVSDNQQRPSPLAYGLIGVTWR